MNFDHQIKTGSSRNISRVQQGSPDRAALFDSFVKQHPELFNAYIDLLVVTFDVEAQLRAAGEKRYTEQILSAERKQGTATTVVYAVYREATDAAVRAHRDDCQRLQGQLNLDITAANELFQQSEKPARVGVNERLAGLEQVRSALHFAAGEMSVPDIGQVAEYNYAQARGALLAEVDARIAPARAVYDASIKAMHEKYRADLKQLDEDHTAFEAPHAAVRVRGLEEARALFSQASGAAYIERHKLNQALDRQFYELEKERLEQIEEFCQRFQSDAGDHFARQHLLAYFELTARLLRDQAEEI